MAAWSSHTYFPKYFISLFVNEELTHTVEMESFISNMNFKEGILPF